MSYTESRYVAPPPPLLTSIKTSSSHGHSRSRNSSITTLRGPATPYDPLTAAVSTAQARYTIANPGSLKAHNEACHHMPGGNTRTVLHATPFPLTWTNGKGCTLTSEDGDVYIDFLGEFTAGIYGHSNPIISDAVQNALRGGWNLGGPNLYERKLAKKIVDRFTPSGLELVRFTNSGTEANTMAIAAAIASTGRKKVLVFHNGYHGGTLSFPQGLSEINTNLPHDFVLAPYNDIDGTKSVIAQLPKDSLAAILVEPIQGSGGCIVGNVEFLKYLDMTAHELEAVFIVDEVMTSRLAYSGVSSSLGLHPDMITLGKWIGGGMSFGAFGGKSDGPMLLFDPREGVLSHSGTFNNNIVTMAAGCAGLDIYTEDEVQRLNDLGDVLKAGVESILLKHKVRGAQPQKIDTPTTSSVGPSPPIIEPHGFDFASLRISEEAGMWISGQGSMVCFHFSGGSEKDLKALLWHHFLDNGIYIAQRGFMALNLELDGAHVETLINSVDSFVVKYRQALATVSD